MWKPDIVVVSPSGAKGVLFMGVLKRLFEEKGFLDNVKTWSGVSAGAAISLLIVAGYKIEEIISLAMEVNLMDDISSLNLNDVKDKLGLIKMNHIEEILKTYMIRKFGTVPTLKQLYILTGIKCVIFAFNVDKLRVEAFDKDTEPDLCCVEAVIMSCSIPILVQPHMYKGSLYVDGGLGAPFPLSHFDKDDNKILGMYISSEEDNYSSGKTPTKFLYKLIQAGMRIIRETEIKYSSKNVKHIALKTTIRDTTGISLDRSIREKMVESGYAYGEDFLKINSNPEKYDVKLNKDEEIPF